MDKLIDLHCDTIWRLMEAGKNATLENNPFCVNLKEMRRADTMAQFFACFVDMQWFQEENKFEEGYQYVKKMIERLRKEVEHFSDKIAFAKNEKEIEENREEGKISAILTVEEGGILNNKIERIEELRNEGIRLMTVLWNYENCIGYPNSKNAEIMAKGLKPFGFEVIERMNYVGMLIDVSHLSDGGFWDILQTSRVPVVASHSNARALCPHPRNMTDDMIRGLGEKGGVIGVNFYPPFIRESGKATAKNIVSHIQHIANVGGMESVCIGTDFDGFTGEEGEIGKVGQINTLYEELKRAKFTEKQIEKIWRGNAMRVIKEVI